MQQKLLSEGLSTAQQLKNQENEIFSHHNDFFKMQFCKHKRESSLMRKSKEKKIYFSQLMRKKLK